MSTIIAQEITILNQAVRTMNGLFSLNDLHKASGGAKKNQPAYFVRLDTTQGLITEIEAENTIENNQSADMQTALVRVNGGVNRGTYACPEIIYAYAMWISSAFYLKVIRHFHESKKSEQLTTLTRLNLTEDQAGHIYQFIHAGCLNIPKDKRPKYFSKTWGDIKREFEVSTYKDVKASDYSELCEFVGTKPNPDYIEGELMPLETLSKLPNGHENIPFKMNTDADYLIRVRSGKLNRKKLMYCIDCQDEKSDWWIEA